MTGENYFLKKSYMDSDGEDFRKDFVDYLQDFVDHGNFQAMSDHTLFLQGGKKAIEEIIEEIKATFPPEEELK